MKELKKIDPEQHSGKYSILIVDDVAKNIQLVAKFLVHEGYDLFFAQSGESAIKQIETRTFDLILLDIMMPGMDGFEVCTKIKSQERSKDIPVIFLTAKTDDEAIVKGFDIGGVDYITKPFNPTELTARVKTHLQLRNRELELKQLNNTKDTLLSVISHDLRTPFFNIMSIGELLLKNYKNYDEKEIIDLIASMIEASRISHNLLENLLNWIRVQTGRILFEPENYLLDDIIRENIQFALPLAENKKIVCKEKIETGIHVFADKNMLNTIIRNLITNAIKYTSREGEVTVVTKRKKKKAIVRVIDNGVGMSVEKVQLLLNHTNFKTTPGTEQESGSGFGLVLAHEFIEKNQGKLTIESTE
ncbi:MAG: hybrid sensor histidine kinase/response regulator, partial [Bacteroidales bacterium]|nr:hybrid sensor histidine kinase/response regulator [Bacteroidales bacterium]